MSKTTRDRSLLFAAAVMLVALLSSAGFLGKTAFSQFDSQYRERLRSGLTTYGVILNYSWDGFRRGLATKESDPAFLKQVASADSTQLRSLVTRSAMAAGADALFLVDAQGAPRAVYSRSAASALDAGACFANGNHLLAVAGRLYATRAVRLSLNGVTLGYWCGMLGITPATQAAPLKNLLRGIPFVRYRGAEYFFDATLKAIPEGAVARGELGRWTENGRHFFGMTGALSLGEDELGIGLLVADDLFRQNVLRGVAAIVFSLIAMLAIGAFALKTMVLQRRTQGKLERAREQALVTLSAIGDSVVTVDTNGRIDYLNTAAETLLGREAETLLGMPWQSVFTLRDESSGRPVDVVAAGRQSREPTSSQGDFELLVGERAVAVAWTAARILRFQPNSGVVIVLRDMSREREFRRELAWRANHDELTRLPNRRCFNQRLTMTLERVRQENSEAALLFLDLDKFKAVNDSCGHEAGDRLLKQVCELFQEELRSGQTLARLGGDEFAILMEKANAEAAERVANALIERLGQYRFVHDDRVFRVGVSIGMTLIDADSADLASVVREADQACYAAKAAGRNCWRRYDRAAEAAA